MRFLKNTFIFLCLLFLWNCSFISDIFKQSDADKLSEDLGKSNSIAQQALGEIDGVDEINIKKTFFAKESWGAPLKEIKYSYPEKIYFHVESANLQPASNGKHSFAADLLVLDPQGNDTLKQDGIIDQESGLKNNELPIKFTIELTPGHPDGIYTVKARIYDKVAQKHLDVSEQFYFEVQNQEKESSAQL